MAPSNFQEFRFTLGVQLKNPLFEKKHILSHITLLENLFPAKQLANFKIVNRLLPNKSSTDETNHVEGKSFDGEII
jgi:hypothetical protein